MQIPFVDGHSIPVETIEFFSNGGLVAVVATIWVLVVFHARQTERAVRRAFNPH